MSEFADAATAAFALLFDVPAAGVNPLWAGTVMVSIAIGLVIVATAWSFRLLLSRIRAHDQELIRRFGRPADLSRRSGEGA